MLLEVVLSMSILRSYFPSFPGLIKLEVLGNREVQLPWVITLTNVITEQVVFVKENGKTFALLISNRDSS